MKILVVKLSALGDILHATPAVRRLLTDRPDAEVWWAVDVRYAAVLELFPGLAGVLVLDPKGWGRLAGGGHPLRAIAEARGTLRDLRRPCFDLALDLQGLVKSALTARLSGAHSVAGMSFRACRERASAAFYGQRVKVDPAQPVVRQLLEVVAAAAGTGREPTDPGLRVPAAAAARAGEVLAGLGGRPIIVVTGAGWPTKVLPHAGLRALAVDLAGDGPLVLLSGSEEERARADAAVEGVTGASVLHRLDLPLLAGVLAGARAVVGGDTGLVHLAAWLGTPTVSWYGASLGSRSGPMGEQHAVIQSGADCSPCFRRDCPHVRCMDDIDPSAIAAAVRRMQRAPA